MAYFGFFFASFFVALATNAHSFCSDILGASYYVESIRNAINEQCPCDEAISRSTYVKCAKAVVKLSLDAGTLPRKCRKDAVRIATRSTCGRPSAVACCARGMCKVYSTLERCESVGNVGTSASCFDACGLICGNGIIESGESCDDRNTVPGDGCSPECQIELAPQCVSINAADYLNTFQSDDFFNSMRGAAEWLEYEPTPVVPMMCIDGDGEYAYFAFFIRKNYPGKASVMMSRPSASEPFQHVLITAENEKAGEIRFASGMYKILIGPDEQSSSVGLYDWEGVQYGNFFAASTAIPTLDSCAKKHSDQLNCMVDTNTIQHHASCLGCFVLMISCSFKPEPLSCVQGLVTCALCLHTDCARVSGQACNARECFRGVCEPTAYIAPIYYECRPTTNYCGECEKCVNDNECKNMSLLRDAVNAKVVQDDIFCSNAISCAECGWCLRPDWPGGCTAFSSQTVRYYDCRGFPVRQCHGSNLFVPNDTCGIRCGVGLCNLESLYSDSWAQIHECSEANGLPYFPRLPIDSVEWYISDQQKSCCPGAKSAVGQ